MSTSSPTPADRVELKGLGKREAERLARRERLLDAAERRFAEVGFEATRLRDVTAAAGTRLASVTEEFGGKEQLFREVLVRRALPLENDRLQRLQSIDISIDGLERLNATVAAFIDPMLARSTEEGWRNYFRFIAQLANSGHLVQLVVAEEYNRVAATFIRSFRQAYPASTEEAAADAYMFMLAAALEVFAEGSRLDSLSGGRFKSADLPRRCKALRVFVTAGIEALLSP
ncbi:TetR/AcrR family transcriptional regulator [Streptomyces djakartensis]|uniref:TetR/AcrR family transcriptional regulator n=1 Tax=Streptomyces djakartensis TaxID=68193 RepID=UPI0034DF60D5